MKIIWIACFGLVGIFSRYGIALLLPTTGEDFPLATFLINLLGSFLIGVVYVAGVEKGIISSEVRIGLTVGLLGGFTTFSAYSLESAGLFRNGHAFLAMTYIVFSSAFAISLTFAGVYLARRIL